MNATEKTKAIRAALKAAGITSKQVSVTHRTAGYSDAWRVVIKDCGVSELEVREICKAFESLDIEEGTGEILMGGNNYIIVSRADGAEPDGAEYLEAVEKTVAKLERDGQGEKVEGLDWVIFKDGNRFIGHSQKINNFELARFFAWSWEGVAGSIASIIKGREIDAAYLERVKA